MSSHCARYPKCGCPASIGTKCQLEDGNPRLGVVEPEIEDDVWETVANQQRKVLKAKLAKIKRNSNFTPPKKKR